MSLLPAKFTLSAWEGATWRKTIVVLTGGSGSSPRDLTGYSAIMHIRTGASNTIVYTLSTANGQITLGGLAGTIALYIPAADTLAFPWSSGIYDLNITAPGGAGDTDALLWGVYVIKRVA